MAAGGKAMSSHGGKEFGVGGDGVSFQPGRIRERDSVFLDEAADALAKALTAGGTGKNGEVKVAPGLVPRAEGSGGDVGANTLGGAAVVGPFPVVDDASSIGGQVSEPAAFHESVENLVGAVLDEVRAIDKHDAGVLLTGSAEGAGALGNLIALSVGAICRCR